MDHDVFISYSTKNSSAAEAICTGLETSGLRCWYGSRDMPPQAEFAETIVEAVRTCAALVLVFSSHENTSPQVVREIDLATSLDKPIVVFRVTDDSPSGSLSYHLSQCRWIDASTPPAASQLAVLVESVRQVLSPATDSRTPDAAVDTAPTRVEAPDVFISYRREDGAQAARLLRSELRARGYRVFLDVDDLRPGHFDDALLHEIEAAPNFVLVLTPDSLARCANERDWMRREIAHALEEAKNIIPIIMQGFVFPEDSQLPEEIRSLTVHHGIPYSHEFFDAMIEKVVGYLHSDT